MCDSVAWFPGNASRVLNTTTTGDETTTGKQYREPGCSAEAKGATAPHGASDYPVAPWMQPHGDTMAAMPPEDSLDGSVATQDRRAFLGCDRRELKGTFS
jgi:hypothetical protein